MSFQVSKSQNIRSELVQMLSDNRLSTREIMVRICALESDILAPAHEPVVNDDANVMQWILAWFRNHPCVTLCASVFLGSWSVMMVYMAVYYNWLGA